MPRGTLVQSRGRLLFVYGTITLFGAAFQLSSTKLVTSLNDSARNPKDRSLWFGLIPVRSPLLRKSLLFSLPSGT